MEELLPFLPFEVRSYDQAPHCGVCYYRFKANEESLKKFFISVKDCCQTITLSCYFHEEVFYALGLHWSNLQQLINFFKKKNCPIEEFKTGFDKEEHLVAAIKQYLLSPEQKEALSERNISIEDVLNGRISLEDSFYNELFADWNTKLGFNHF